MEKNVSSTLMTEGSIWKKIIAFAIPLFLGNLFQQLYNTAAYQTAGILMLTGKLIIGQ